MLPVSAFPTPSARRSPSWRTSSRRGRSVRYARGRTPSRCLPNAVLQLVALADIGAFGAALVERREQVFGKRFDFAGDELSGEEQAKILSHAIGRPIYYQEIPIAAARQQSEDAALMFEWFDRVGYDADIAALRRDFSEIRWHSFADWAREFDWSVLERTSSVA